MRTAILLSPVVYLLSIGISVFAQQRIPPKPISEEDVIRVETNLVTLPVKVSSRGNIVFGLQREQFQVFENGIEQEIVYFESPHRPGMEKPDVRPLTIALMLDVSDSTEYKLARIKDAASSFIDVLRPEDQVLVIAFDNSVQVLVESTSDRYIVRRAINALHTGAGTSLYAALSEVIGKRLAHVTGRKAIVLLTDGVDTTNKSMSFDAVMHLLETSDVTIYPIQYDTYGDFADNPSRETYGVGNLAATSHVTKNGESVSEAYKRATRYLRLLAEKTAGHFQYADNSKSLAKSFDTIAHQLREHYTVGYYPKDKTDGVRKIEIRIKDNRELNVRTRRSYVYKSLR